MGERPRHRLPPRASGATLGRLAPELGERTGCAVRRWGLSISRIDKLPLGEGRLCPLGDELPRATFQRKTRCPPRAAPGPAGQRRPPEAGRLRPAVPQPARQPGPRPPRLASQSHPARRASLGLRAPTPCRAECGGRCHPRTPAARAGRCGERPEAGWGGRMGGGQALVLKAVSQVQSGDRRNATPRRTP